MNDDKPTVRGVLKETLSKGYVKRALQRGASRNSAWNLLLLPIGGACITGAFWLLVLIMWNVHLLFHSEHANKFADYWRVTGKDTSISSFMLLAPLLFASLPVGLMLTNCILWCIPPARRVFDTEANGVKWASFGERMQSLWSGALIIVSVCLIVSLIGAITLTGLK